MNKQDKALLLRCSIFLLEVILVAIPIALLIIWLITMPSL